MTWVVSSGEEMAWETIWTPSIVFVFFIGCPILYKWVVCHDGVTTFVVFCILCEVSHISVTGCRTEMRRWLLVVSEWWVSKRSGHRRLSFFSLIECPVYQE